ncbi:MAG: hypothetical protein QM778_18755 [Myxococcales bacterium]
MIRRGRDERVVGLALALLVLVLSGSMGCHDASQAAGSEGDIPSTLGDTQLTLLLGTGVSINAIQWKVERDTLIRQGTFAAPGTGSTFSGLIQGLPPGEDYRLTLTATAIDGSATCAGQATFTVNAGTQTAVMTHLQCRRQAAEAPPVLVSGDLNVCPDVLWITAIPSSIGPGQSTSLASGADDYDLGPTTLKYAWTADSGTFHSPNAANTTFAATATGTVNVTLTVSDGDCTDSLSVAITVVNRNLPDAGADACLACELSEHNGASLCPDHYQTGAALVGTTAVMAANPYSGQPRAEIFRHILECIHTTGCAGPDSQGNLWISDCFCGIGVDPNPCFGSTYAAAAGPCKQQIAAGAESENIEDVNDRFFDSAYALGAATAVVEVCDQFSCVNECLVP